MTPIDPAGRLAAALQTQLAALRERVAARGLFDARPSSKAAGASITPAMAQRLQAIDRSSPDRQRRAVRIYLERSLAREFGDGLLNDPLLPQMLDAVQEQMQSDPQLAAAAQAAGDLLLSGRVR